MNEDTMVHLLSLLQQKDEVVESQNNIISKLLNENIEKENMINVLLIDMEDN